MTPERWAQTRRIFEAAVERPARNREAWVERACGDDAELRREVMALLESHDGAGEFLEKPAADLNRALVSSSSVSSISSPIESVEYPGGFQVGGYQLQKCIARGGMGSVWLATRPGGDPAQRFAIKMVKRGMDTREILRRFRTERQVLASLDHPNIARLLDAGSTPEGLPYLVMEYVEGQRIDHYCESKRISISDRLILFRQVCQAVQYAHQKLVVHRDLKPGNILVTPEGVPKLLDFGIAKLLAGTPEGATETRPELRAMTLQYASPEQIRGDPVTTSTDVYSLGVLLFRLLTGKSPYTSKVRTADALRQAVCEQEPARASSVILTDSETAVPDSTQKLEAFSESRERARRRLRKKLSGDLDTILMMALRKEPDRRYASVEQFSEDVRRYLEGRPVLARGGATAYRISKFLRRNVAGAVVGSLLIVGLAIVASVAAYYERQTAQRERTVRVEQQALQQELLRTYLRASDLDGRKRALEIAQTVQRTQPEAAAAKKDVMTAARRLGASQLDSGDQLAALANFSIALQAAESLPPTDPDASRCQAACNLAVGEILAHNGEREAAAVKLRKALDEYRELTKLDMAARDSTVESFQRALADLARKATPELRAEIETELKRFRRVGDK